MFSRAGRIACNMQLYAKQWFHSIHGRIFLIIEALVIIPIALSGLYFYSTTSQILLDRSLSEMDNQLDTSLTSLQAQLDTIDNTFFNLVNDQTINQNLKRLAATKSPLLDPSIAENNELEKQAILYERNDARSNIEAGIRRFSYFNTAWNSKLLKSIFLFDHSGNYFKWAYDDQKVNPTKENLDIYSQLQSDTTDYLVFPPSNRNPTIYYFRDFFLLDDFEHPYTIILGIDEEKLSDSYVNLLSYENSYAFITDDSNRVISHSIKSYLNGIISNQNLEDLHFADSSIRQVHTTYYFSRTLKLSDKQFQLVVAIPKSSILKELENSKKGYLFFWVSFFLVSFFISLLLSNLIDKYIIRIVSLIDRIKEGDYKVKIARSSISELDNLGKNINSMAKRIDHLINEVYEKQYLLKTAELSSLQSQINPHFLFNTLLTIECKAKMAQDETIFKMISSLSKLLSASIYQSGREMISLREEMELIELYVYLQKVRFGDKVRVNLPELSSKQEKYQVPKLSLQPIVENAFVHGIEPKLESGTISMVIEESDLELTISITDDGVGFDSSGFSLDHDPDVINGSGNHKSIGLRNAHRRIKLIYGSDYGITLTSHPEVGTKVIVRLPVDQGVC